ncbi:TetR/AcrR family transcriptional regulator [Bradyrhizobium tropiciagri]|uniref:TetR/AcrR family transcriptional regulator n=1 Tax=Bradyrhizobium tropiciagri TaxID=312253 RepID=UPI00067B5FE7|nr:TetR/AcrR family transcriptional regulator [Bradyrhizobium tropiciagri]
MHHDKDNGSETCARIVALASRHIRKHGVDSLRVVDLMRAAGLTHGGFYYHFDSRKDLIDRAFAHAVGESVGQWRSISARAEAGRAFADIVAFYLNEGQRLDVGAGCALPALGAEASRAGAAARNTFTAGLREMVMLIVQGSTSRAMSRCEAMAALSLMVGSVLLARAADDECLAGEILSAGRAMADAAAATSLSPRSQGARRSGRST